MPVTLDPRLQEIAEREEREKQEQAATAEALAAPVEELTPDSTPEVAIPAEEHNQEQVIEQQVPVDNRLFLDPTQAYRELVRLEQESEAVRNAIKTRTGRYAAKEYKPKLAELEHERNQLKQEIAQLKAQSLDEDELKERLLRDPEFRRQYDSINQPSGPDPRLQAVLESQFTEAVEEAEQYLPPEVLGRYVTALTQQGWYDYERNAQGQPTRALTPDEGMRRFQADLNRASINAIKQAQAPRPPMPNTPPPPPQASAPAPVAQVAEPAPAPIQPNLALASSSPDLTPNSVTRAAGAMTLGEYNDLSEPTKMKLFPEGLGAALESGKVYRD